VAVVSTEIRDQGRAAKTRGEPMSANPYEVGSQESLDWLEGFTFDEKDPTAVEEGQG